MCSSCGCAVDRLLQTHAQHALPGPAPRLLAPAEYGDQYVQQLAGLLPKDELMRKVTQASLALGGRAAAASKQLHLQSLSSPVVQYLATVPS